MSDTGEFFINCLECADVGIVSPAYPVFEIKDSSVLDKDYLKFFFKSVSFNKKITLLSKGSTRLSLKFKDLKNIEIDLPSLEEQKRIALVIGKIYDLLDVCDKQRNDLNELIRTRFIEIFGEVETNEKGFPMKTMAECCDFIGGSQPDKKYFEYEKRPDNIRLIQIRDYKSDKFLTYIPIKLARKTCTTEDIMIGRYGPPIFQILGGIAGAYNVALMKAVPTSEFDSHYFRYFLKDDKLLAYLESYSKRTAGQDGIQMDKLNCYPCFVPPLQLQKKFSSFARAVERELEHNAEQTKMVNDLLEIKMEEYFE